MSSNSIAAAIAVILMLFVTACDGQSTEDAHDHEAEGAAGEAAGHDEEASGEHEATAEEHAAEEGEGDHVPLGGVRGVSFSEVGAPVEEGVWYPGEALAAGDERAILTSPVEGVVSAIRVPPGREVPSGAPLLTVRSPELAALAATLLASTARREQAAAELAREERLRAANAGAARELEAALAALAVAEADEPAARLALEARGISLERAGATVDIRAPLRGRVSTFDVLVGQGVEARQQLGTFETARASLARLELPLPGPSTWSAGVPTIVRRGDGKTWTAKVEGLPSSLSAQTRRLIYRLRLEGENLPYPGTPLEVECRYLRASSFRRMRSSRSRVNGACSSWKAKRRASSRSGEDPSSAAT